MKTAKSRLGLNLVGQFFMGGMLGSLAHSLPPGLHELFNITGMLIFASSMFGFVYLFFRLFGARGEVLEAWYQNFPIGFLSASKGLEEPVSPVGPAASGVATFAPVGAALQKQKSSLEADSLFSVKYLRFAGLLLIVSAVFSFLFNIDWQLTQKIIAALAGGLLAWAGAEYLRPRRPGLAALSFIVGFALLQFALTLLFAYSRVEAAEGFWAQTNVWLALKFFFTAGSVILLLRQRVDFAPSAFFVIAYLTPLTLLRIIDPTPLDPGIPLAPGLLYLIAMTALMLSIAVFTRSYELLPINTAAANLYGLLFFMRDSGASLLPFLGSAGWQTGAVDAAEYETSALAAIAFFIGLFFTQLAVSAFAAVSQAGREPKAWDAPLMWDVVLAHLAVVVGLAAAFPLWPAASGYLGVSLLLIALISFGVYLALRQRGLPEIMAAIPTSTATLPAA